MNFKPKLLVVCGPTATGKTALAVSLAKQYNGELVSADSRQVYRGMDIGTGKDLQEKLSAFSSQLSAKYNNKTYVLSSYVFDGIPLWLYDVVDPDQEFSVAQYETLARAVIDDIHARGKLPILVGGTGLYIKAVVEGIPTSVVPRNESLRNELAMKSLADLQQMLKDKHPEVWDGMNNSDRNNPRRLVRKIEISQFVIPTSVGVHGGNLYNSLIIGLKVDSTLLAQKITSRVRDRVDQGIIQEIDALLKKGYSWNLPSMNTFGYKEWKHYIDDRTEANKQQAIHDWTHNEINYVKKQITWFKKQKNIQWFDVTDSKFPENAIDTVRLWYTSK